MTHSDYFEPDSFFMEPQVIEYEDKVAIEENPYELDEATIAEIRKTLEKWL